MSEGHVTASRDIRNALIMWLELPADTTLTLSKLGEMMEDSFAKHRAVLAPYYQDMVECIEAQEAALISSQARLSEAVKVLERVKGVVTYPCDRSIQERGYGVRSIDVSGCEYIAEAIDAFIATLGEET